MFSGHRRRALQVTAAAALGSLLPACRPAEDAARTARPVFGESALRLDLRHDALDAADVFTLAQLRAEPHWPRALTGLAEAPDWGDYRLTLQDSDSGTIVFREGFDSPAAHATAAASTRLSLRFPRPQRKIRAAIEKRRGEGYFHEAWAVEIDPLHAEVDGTASAIETRVDVLLENGAPASKLDLAILGDGYRAGDHGKFIADARRAMRYVFSVEPFASRVRGFNVRAVFAASAHSGVTDAYLERRRDTAFDCAYGTGEAERTLAVGNHFALREAAAHVPYDALLVIANARRYGGSAHLGGPAVVAIDSAAAKYLVLHELAHAVGGLAEEYYLPAADAPAYKASIEPWQPNVTARTEKPKWRDADGALPQRAAWNKAEYDSHFSQYVARYFAMRARRAEESAVEALMMKSAAAQAALLAKNTPLRRVALFEGAHGYASGVFRSEVDCIMFSLTTRHFCAACEAALNQAIDFCCR